MKAVKEVALLQSLIAAGEVLQDKGLVSLDTLSSTTRGLGEWIDVELTGTTDDTLRERVVFTFYVNHDPGFTVYEWNYEDHWLAVAHGPLDAATAGRMLRVFKGEVA